MAKQTGRVRHLVPTKTRLQDERAVVAICEFEEAADNLVKSCGRTSARATIIGAYHRVRRGLPVSFRLRAFIESLNPHLQRGVAKFLIDVFERRRALTYGKEVKQADVLNSINYERIRPLCNTIVRSKRRDS